MKTHDRPSFHIPAPETRACGGRPPGSSSWPSPAFAGGRRAARNSFLRLMLAAVLMLGAVTPLLAGSSTEVTGRS